MTHPILCSQFHHQIPSLGLVSKNTPNAPSKTVISLHPYSPLYKKKKEKKKKQFFIHTKKQFSGNEIRFHVIDPLIL